LSSERGRRSGRGKGRGGEGSAARGAAYTGPWGGGGERLELGPERGREGERTLGNERERLVVGNERQNLPVVLEGTRRVSRRDNFGVARDDEKRKILSQRAALSRGRYLICQLCEDTVMAGAGCRHHKACCFGQWRSVETNRCAIGKW